MNHLIGAHLSIAGGYENALTKVYEIGGNCLQIFSSSPRQWMHDISIYDTKIEKFLELKKKLGINPIYFHASYLVNFADNGRIGSLSKNALINELNLAEKLEIKGSIVHLGSFKGQTPNYDVLVANIQEVLANTPSETMFLIENAGNKKICCGLTELGYIVKRLNNNRVRVCLDTCHLWATGYDLSTREKFTEFFSEFDKKVGLGKLEVMQINDSKDALGSFRDRHENIGEGTIPPEEFRLILNKPQTRNLPLILEVPGFDAHGPDQKNIEILKSLVT